MLNQPTLPEKIIRSLSDLDDMLDLPHSMNQVLYRDLYQYFKAKRRFRAEEQRQRKRIKECLRRLEKAQVLTYQKNIGKYKLTPKGWLKYLYYQTKYKSNKSKKGKVKNNCQYIVIFDIPEEYRHFRNLFRYCLINLRFKIIQKSVLLGNDEDCFKWAQKIVINCELDGHVKFIEATKIY